MLLRAQVFLTVVEEARDLLENDVQAPMQVVLLRIRDALFFFVHGNSRTAQHCTVAVAS